MNQKAQETIKLIELGIERGEAACLPKLMRIINTLSVNVCDLPLFQLTELIQNDAVILQKIISSANKFGYNPYNVPITTLLGAIQVIGFDRIRSLTMALILLDNSQKRDSSDERKNAALLAISAGLMTSKMAKAADPRINADMAFVCGSLRSYGLLLVATFMTEATKLAESYVCQMPRSKAYQKVFGLTPLELSHYILSTSSKLPKVLIDALKEYDHNAYKMSNSSSAEGKLVGLSDFGLQLSELALDPSVDEPSFRRRIASMNEKYKAVIDRDADFYTERVREAHHYVSELRSSVGTKAFPELGFSCLKARSAQENPPLPTPSKKIVAGIAGANENESHETGSDSLRVGHEWIEPEESKIEGVYQTNAFWENEIELMDQHQQEEGLSPRVIDQLFRILKKGFDCNESLIFLPRPGRKGFQLYRGMGRYESFLGKSTTIHPSEASIFGLCLQRKEIIVIGDAKSAKIRPHLPKWYLDNVNLNAFALCSLHDDQGLAGLVYIGWENSRNFKIQPEKIPLVRQIMARIAQFARVDQANSTQ
ncbi:MAG: HD-like signal output (HDOD) protein [Lentimonas sp.]|jgi:HD-like signal output (HDOD) protein